MLTLLLAVMPTATSAGAQTGAASAGASSKEGSQQAARRAVQQGRFVPLEQVIRDALRRHPGQLLEVELDDEDAEYEVEILRADGVVVELDYDARDGRLLKIELDED